MAKLRTLAQTSGFCNCLQDSLIRDRIFLGVADAYTRKRLLQHSKLTLQQSIEICRRFEAFNSQIRQINEQGRQDDVNKVKSTRTKKKEGGARNKGKYNEFKQEQTQYKLCGNCGRKHKFGREFCPAWARHVTLVEGEVILQSSAGKAEEIIQTKLKNLIQTLILNILIP